MKFAVPTSALMLFAVSVICSEAADSGASVAVIYNSNLKESKAVAEHYAARRSVPENNVIGLMLPTGETMSRAEYKVYLQKPLLKELTKRKLFEFDGRKLKDAAVRYLVLCYGVPLKIERDITLTERDDDKLKAALRGRNEAAVDSELALLPRADDGDRLAGYFENLLFGTTNSASFHPTNGIIMVARLDGPSMEIANGLVDRAIWAETNGWWGRAYFDLRGIKDGEYQQGDDWLAQGARTARDFGWETEVDEKPALLPDGFPLSHIGLYAGWYAEHPVGPFALPQLEFLPGAFAYHLHSFSANTLRSTNQHWVGPFLAKGATATMGAVYEPYLSGTPQIGVFLSSFLQGQFSFGEAAYASQRALSWQVTVVGDPLYRPFARHPRELHEDLEKRKSALVEWSHLRVVNLNLAKGSKPSEMLGYLQQQPLAQNSAILLEKAGDLLQQEGKRLEGVQVWDLALKKNPSPQQTIRIILKLARELVAIGRVEEARKVYGFFVQRYSLYPQIETIRRELEKLKAGNSKIQNPNPK